MHKKQGDKDRVMYRDSLQNYPIDTGEEVILADTGLPAGTPEENPDETSAVYTGKDICSYKEAFAALGYEPQAGHEDAADYKHADHSGEPWSFPNTRIYVSRDEVSAAELHGIDIMLPVSFTDGPCYYFPDSRKIGEGITMIKVKGHTNGNSTVIIE